MRKRFRIKHKKLKRDRDSGREGDSGREERRYIDKIDREREKERDRERESVR